MLPSPILAHCNLALRSLPVQAQAFVGRHRAGSCRRLQHCQASADDFEDLPVVGESSGRLGDVPASDALIKSLQEITSQEGRSSDRRNTLVLGNDKRTLDAWRRVDKKVNKYPGKRVFKAVGEGGENFARSMEAAVEQTLGPLPPDVIQHRLSSHQRFLSVTIGPVTVDNSNQVVEVYQTMKKDSRLKFCM